MAHWHSLTPFSAQPMSYSVQAQVERIHDKLMLSFELTDPQNEVIWQPQDEIKRQDFLWENTCFEAFIGTPSTPEYFELNLSPARAWNLYRFTDYRTPNVMPPISVNEPVLLNLDVDHHKISATIDLNMLKLKDIEIKLGLTAVIKTTDSLHYFAIQHPLLHADFHDAQGWTILLLPDNT